MIIKYLSNSKHSSHEKSDGICFCLLVTISIQAQDYYASFAVAGASTTLSTVKVDNLTKGTTVALNDDDILHLAWFAMLPETKLITP